MVTFRTKEGHMDKRIAWFHLHCEFSFAHCANWVIFPAYIEDNSSQPTAGHKFIICVSVALDAAQLLVRMNPVAPCGFSSSAAAPLSAHAGSRVSRAWDGNSPPPTPGLPRRMSGTYAPRCGWPWESGSDPKEGERERTLAVVGLGPESAAMETKRRGCFKGGLLASCKLTS